MGRPSLNLLRRLVLEEDGPTAVEYAVMLAMILVMVIGAITQVGGTTDGMYGGISSAMQAAGT